MSRAEARNSQAQGILIPRGVDLAPYKTIRLAVSGDVKLNKLEIDIIDTPDFQRLRRIRQLGVTYLVYPTALHTRFDHSLGTVGMANRMILAIRTNRHNSQDERDIPDEDEQIIRLLALLHDVTHIPFGHTLEDECSVFDRHDTNTVRIQHFLGSDSAIGKLIIDRLGKPFYDRFMRVYQVKKDSLASLEEDVYIYDIVNNTVCADLLDYLRRDCYFSNLVLDMEYRFLNYLYLARTGKERRVVVRLWKTGKSSPRPDILSELVRLLDNRYLLGERVYFHHTKLIAGAMLADAVQRAVANRDFTEKDLWTWGDEDLLEILTKSKAEPVRTLAMAVRNRGLWKQIYKRNRQRIDAEQSEHRDAALMDQTMGSWWKDAKKRQADQDFIATCSGLPPGALILYCPDERMNLKLAEVKVFWNGSIRELRQCEDEQVVGPKLKTILDSHKQLWAVRAFLAPQYIEKKEACTEGLESILSFDSLSRDMAAKEFYSKVIERVTKESNLDTCSHSEYVQRQADALERVMSDTATVKNTSKVEEIIKNAFTK